MIRDLIEIPFEIRSKTRIEGRLISKKNIFQSVLIRGIERVFLNSGSYPIFLYRVFEDRELTDVSSRHFISLTIGYMR